MKRLILAIAMFAVLMWPVVGFACPPAPAPGHDGPPCGDGPGDDDDQGEDNDDQGEDDDDQGEDEDDDDGGCHHHHHGNDVLTGNVTM